MRVVFLMRKRILDILRSMTKSVPGLAFMMILAISLNVCGKIIAMHFQLPLWLDSFGTVAIAYALGPVQGAACGLATNLIFGMFVEKTWIYGIVGAAVGIICGVSARNGCFKNAFETMICCTNASLVATLFSVIINYNLYDGVVGNIWGDGVAGFIIEKTGYHIPAYLLGEFYIDFPDKLITLQLFYILLFLLKTPFGNKTHTSKNKKTEKTAALLILLIIIPSSVIAGSALSVSAEENDKVSEDTVSSDTVSDYELFTGGDLDMEFYSYVQTVYSSNNGLPCGEANDIASTPDGILWIGTYAGLYRYNGRDFTFMNFPSVRNVNCLYVDDEGRLWVGTNDNGLTMCIKEKAVNVIDRSTGLPANSVRSIIRGSDGYYYVGTAGSMQVYDLEDGLKISNTLDDVIYSHDLSADKNGNVCSVTNGGDLFILNGGKILHRAVSEISERKFTCSCFDAYGYLYVGCSDGTVFKYEIGSGLKRVGSYKIGEDENINSLSYTDDGIIFACADRGVGYILPNGKTGTILLSEFKNSIDHMITDYQGNYWFASSRAGIMRMSRSPFTDYYGAAGLKSKVVNSVAFWNGRMYCGTDSGLDCIDSSGKAYEDEVTEFFASDRIRCLNSDDNGNLWICCYGRGLYRIGKDGEIEEFNSENGQFCDWVRLSVTLSDGTVVCSGDTGLFFYKNGRITGRLSMDDLSLSAMILCVYEKEDGTLLVGSDGDGIAAVKNMKVVDHFNEDNGLSSGVILRICGTRDKRLIAICSNGLNRIDTDYSIHYIANFPYTNNYDYVVSKNGRGFVLCSAGLYVLKEEDLLSDVPNMECELIDSGRGLMSALTVNSWNVQTDSDILYLSGVKGAYSLDLNNYSGDHKTYRMILNKVTIDGVDQSVDRGSDIFMSRNSSRIYLYPEIINYTLATPDVVYSLPGVDLSETRIPLSDFTGVQYNDIPYGNNKFIISVVDAEGAVLEKSEYHIVRETAIWDSVGFTAYMFLVGSVAIVWFTLLFARTRMKRTLDIQKREVEVAKQQVKMSNETIMAVARTVDAKDGNTSLHSKRVSEYSALIAKELGFTDEECENIRSAALLHDIGKIGIPDRILNKPARLTDEEYAVMKTHVTRGAEILKDFTLVEHVVEGAKYHHEKYDGTGYPEGLKGEGIPLYGRIIGVADAFDAMTQNRVYRKKLDASYVYGELERCKGTQFDPEIADIMLKLAKEGKLDEILGYKIN